MKKHNQLSLMHRKAYCSLCIVFWMCQCTIYAQDSLPMRKIVLISPMLNIWARFVQDCTYFPNTQYMRKICICARLYLFPQCAIYAQDLCKIVLISPMRNICTRLYFSPQCAKFEGIIGRNMSHITYLL